jgi:NAD(P)H-dependent FMN reductase
MKLLTLCGSLRTGSLNRRLLTLAEAVGTEQGAEVTNQDLRELVLPMYDGDVEDSTGLPEGARKLCDLIAASDGLIIASPEYNHSMAGTTKNAIDWVSRARPVPFKDKHVLLLSASPGLVGGNRGLWSLRVPLENLGCHVYPGMFSLASADKAFAEDGSFNDEAAAQRLSKLVTEFMKYLARFIQ